MSRWKRISVELSQSWPGEPYLRFEAPDGTATMVAVDADDLARIAGLQHPLGLDYGPVPGQSDPSLWISTPTRRATGRDVMPAFPPEPEGPEKEPIQPAWLTAELTLDDGTVVYVQSGVVALGPAKRGRITVRVICPVSIPAGGMIARVVIRTSEGVEAPWVFQPPQPVPLTGWLDVPLEAGDLQFPPGYWPEEV